MRAGIWCGGECGGQPYAYEVPATPTTATSSKNVPPSILGADGRLPPGIGGTGTPIPMQPSSNPNLAAGQFAQAVPAGQASTRTDPNTATV